MGEIKYGIFLGSSRIEGKDYFTSLFIGINNIMSRINLALTTLDAYGESRNYLMCNQIRRSEIENGYYLYHIKLVEIITISGEDEYLTSLEYFLADIFVCC